MLKDALQTGAIKPLKTTVFDVTECEQAFRYMAAGKHMGKVLLKLRDEEEQRVALPVPKYFPSEPRFFCSDQKTYIIIGKWTSVQEKKPEFSYYGEGRYKTLPLVTLLVLTLIAMIRQRLKFDPLSQPKSFCLWKK